MRTYAAGPSRRLLCNRNNDLQLIYRFCLEKYSIRIDRDPNLRLRRNVPHGRQRLFSVPAGHPDDTGHTVIRFHCLLQQSHYSTSPNSERPLKLPSPNFFIFIGFTIRCTAQSSGLGKVMTPFSITGFHRPIVILSFVSSDHASSA